MTANRLPFRVTAIRDAIERRLADDIDAAEAKFNGPSDAELLELWRTAAIKSVRSLAARHARGTVLDSELSGWSVPYAPRAGKSDDMQQALRDAVEAAYGRRDVAVHRLEAIRSYVPEGETEAVLDLTPSMARDWFGI